MHIRLTILLLLSGFAASAQQPLKDSVNLQTVLSHPMQYYVSLPEGWAKSRKWPVVVVIEAADKEYRENALRFVRARKQMPFIIVAPYNVNNSRSGRRDPKVFPYSSKDWDYIEQVGDCKFNLDGLNAVMQDVQQRFAGESTYYLTGFEAGAHTVWQMVFQHPEKLKAAIAVAGNYNQNSCMTDESLFSKSVSLANLPVVGFLPENDPYFGPKGKVNNQWTNAKSTAMAHGYRNVQEVIIPGKDHVPLPQEVMDYFYKAETAQK